MESFVCHVKCLYWLVHYVHDTMTLHTRMTTNHNENSHDAPYSRIGSYPTNQNPTKQEDYHSPQPTRNTISTTSQQQQQRRRNASRLSTSDIVKVLQANETTRLMMEEYLKYEYPIYYLARHYHNQQYAWLLSQQELLEQTKREQPII